MIVSFDYGDKMEPLPTLCLSFMSSLAYIYNDHSFHLLIRKYNLLVFISGVRIVQQLGPKAP